MVKIILGIMLSGFLLTCGSAHAGWRPAFVGWTGPTADGRAQVVSTDKRAVAAAACGTTGQWLGFDHLDENTNSIYCRVYADVSHHDWGTTLWYAGQVQLVAVCPSSSMLYGDLNMRCYESPEKRPECPCYGNPVKFGNKEKIQYEEDFHAPSGLDFFRYYSSKRQEDKSALGYSWGHNYDKTLVVKIYDQSKTYSYQWNKNPDGTGRWTGDWGAMTPSNATAKIVNHEGYGYYFFSVDRGNTWSADDDVKAKLAVSAIDPATGVATQWQLTLSNGDVEIYDAAGRIAEIRYLTGRKLTMTYSTQGSPDQMGQRTGFLTDVINDLGQSLHFTYDESSRLIAMTDPIGNVYQYSYGGNKTTLISVSYPGGGRREYHYDEQGLVSSKTTGWQYLTGISDEITPGNLVRTGTYTYNEKGFPISTARANGIEKYIFDYTVNTITDPLGAVRTYAFTTVNGAVFLSAISQKYGSITKTVSNSYDVNGNLKIAEDFNGQRIFKVFDLTRNLELKSTEAIDSAFARTISTSWHLSLPLPIKVAEPMRLITYSYDEVGNMLTKTVQATTDPNGAQGLNATTTGMAEIWTYTYNSARQVLTVKGPRTDFNDITTLTYDTAGNLASIVNPAGHTTTITNYDAAGRPGIITNPNGDMVSMTYTPRGWLSSRTLAAVGRSETTTYGYDDVGQLTMVSLPDGSTLNYSYDDASRLVAISDSMGNRIDYTLDNLGNRIAEQVRDPNGILFKNTVRIFDSLGRMIQQTGGAQ